MLLLRRVAARDRDPPQAPRPCPKCFALLRAQAEAQGLAGILLVAKHLQLHPHTQFSCCPARSASTNVVSALLIPGSPCLGARGSDRQPVVVVQQPAWRLWGRACQLTLELV